MNKFYKKKWVEALRSGEYEQGAGILCTRGKDFDSFCCLGVLCDLVSQEKNEPWVNKSDNTISNIFRNESSILPKSLQTSLHISHSAHMTLIEMNDNGKSFKTIANWIEKNL